MCGSPLLPESGLIPRYRLGVSIDRSLALRFILFSRARLLPLNILIQVLGSSALILKSPGEYFLSGFSYHLRCLRGQPS